MLFQRLATTIDKAGGKGRWLAVEDLHGFTHYSSPKALSSVLRHTFNRAGIEAGVTASLIINDGCQADHLLLRRPLTSGRGYQYAITDLQLPSPGGILNRVNDGELSPEQADILVTAMTNDIINLFSPADADYERDRRFTRHPVPREADALIRQGVERFQPIVRTGWRPDLPLKFDRLDTGPGWIHAMEQLLGLSFQGYALEKTGWLENLLIRLEVIDSAASLRLPCVLATVGVLAWSHPRSLLSGPTWEPARHHPVSQVSSPGISPAPRSQVPTPGVATPTSQTH